MSICPTHCIQESITKNKFSENNQIKSWLLYFNFKLPAVVLQILQWASHRLTPCNPESLVIGNMCFKKDFFRCLGEAAASESIIEHCTKCETEVWVLRHYSYHQICYADIFPTPCVGTHSLIDDKAVHSLQHSVMSSWPPPTLKTMSIFNSLKVTLVHTIVSVCVGGKVVVVPESSEPRGL